MYLSQVYLMVSGWPNTPSILHRKFDTVEDNTLKMWVLKGWYCW
jgi:hypothetical protein